MGHGASAASSYLDNVCHLQLLCWSRYLYVFDRVISAFDGISLHICKSSSFFPLVKADNPMVSVGQQRKEQQIKK